VFVLTVVTTHLSAFIPSALETPYSNTGYQSHGKLGKVVFGGGENLNRRPGDLDHRDREGGGVNIYNRRHVKQQ